MIATWAVSRQTVLQLDAIWRVRFLSGRANRSGRYTLKGGQVQFSFRLRENQRFSVEIFHVPEAQNVNLVRLICLKFVEIAKICPS